MSEIIPSSAVKRPGSKFTKVIKVAILVFLVLDVAAVLIWGGFKLSRKMVDSDATKEQAELLALNKILDNARVADSDLDGLSNEQEQKSGTDPGKGDTDGDGVLDRVEIEVLKTDPRKADTDGDGLKDGYEIRRNRDPLKKDK